MPTINPEFLQRGVFDPFAPTYTQEERDAYYQQLYDSDPELQEQGDLYADGIDAIHAQGDPRVLPSKEQILAAGKAVRWQKSGWNFSGGLGALWEEIKDTPKHVAASLIDMAYGAEGTDVVDPNFLQKWSQKVKREEELEAQELARKYQDQKFLPGIDIKDIIGLDQSLGFSISNIVPATAAGVATTTLTGNPIAGWIAAGGASGYAAKEASEYQYILEVLNYYNERSVKERGRPINAEEQEVIRAHYIDLARKHGLWEAIPEAVGNVGAAKIIFKPILKKAPGLGLRLIKKFAGAQSVEQFTETVTQMGQTGIAQETEKLQNRERVKGPGYLGKINLPDGNYATEYSIGVNIDGEDVEIPTLVPTLTPEELEYMRTEVIPKGLPIPEQIKDKAVQHAYQRIENGQSPFKGDRPPADFTNWRSWWQAFKEQAPKTFLVTTILGGGAHMAKVGSDRVMPSRGGPGVNVDEGNSTEQPGFQDTILGNQAVQFEAALDDPQELRFIKDAFNEAVETREFSSNVVPDEKVNELIHAGSEILKRTPDDPRVTKNLERLKQNYESRIRSDEPLEDDLQKFETTLGQDPQVNSDLLEKLLDPENPLNRTPMFGGFKQELVGILEEANRTALADAAREELTEQEEAFIEDEDVTEEVEPSPLTPEEIGQTEIERIQGIAELSDEELENMIQTPRSGLLKAMGMNRARFESRVVSAANRKTNPLNRYEYIRDRLLARVRNIEKGLQEKGRVPKYSFKESIPQQGQFFTNTEEALQFGKSVKSDPTAIQQLKSRYQDGVNEVNRLRSEGQAEAAFELAQKNQFFREAAEIAKGDIKYSFNKDPEQASSNFDQVREKLVNSNLWPAVLQKSTGRIFKPSFRASTHSDIYSEHGLGNYNAIINKLERGFLDQNNNFLSREEIARQIGMEGANITSEDLKALGQANFTPAVRNPDTGQIFTGVIHGEAINNMLDEIRQDLEPGFELDGKFLTRNEASKHLGVEKTVPELGTEYFFPKGLQVFKYSFNKRDLFDKAVSKFAKIQKVIRESGIIAAVRRESDGKVFVSAKQPSNHNDLFIEHNLDFMDLSDDFTFGYQFPDTKEFVTVAEAPARLGLTELTEVLNSEYLMPIEEVFKFSFSEAEQAETARILGQISQESTTGNLLLDTAIEQSYMEGPGIDIQAAFPGASVEGTQVGLPNGQILEVETVESIVPDEAFVVGRWQQAAQKGAQPAGAYQDGRIRLRRNAGGQWTLHHESWHFIEDFGLVTPKEMAALKGRVIRDIRNGKMEANDPENIGSEEDRADWVANNLTAQPKGLVGSFLEKIRNFLDSLSQLVGRPTARSVVENIRTGRIFTRGPNRHSVALSEQPIQLDNIDMGNMTLKKVVQDDPFIKGPEQDQNHELVIEDPDGVITRIKAKDQVDPAGRKTLVIHQLMPGDNITPDQQSKANEILIRYAAQNGPYEGVAWLTNAEQNNLNEYQVRSNMDSVSWQYNREDNEIYVLAGRSGNAEQGVQPEVLVDTVMPLDELPLALGTSITGQIIQNLNQGSTSGNLTGNQISFNPEDNQPISSAIMGAMQKFSKPEFGSPEISNEAIQSPLSAQTKENIIIPLIEKQAKQGGLDTKLITPIVDMFATELGPYVSVNYLPLTDRIVGPDQKSAFPRYSFKTNVLSKDSKIRNFFADSARALFKSNLIPSAENSKMGNLQKLLLSPEFYSNELFAGTEEKGGYVGFTNRIMDKQSNFNSQFQKLNQITDSDGKPLFYNPGELKKFGPGKIDPTRIREAQNKTVVSETVQLKNLSPKDYKVLENMLEDGNNWVGKNKIPKDFIEYWRSKGASEKVLDLYQVHRNKYDFILKKFIEPLYPLESEESFKFMGRDFTVAEIAERMNQLKGFYAPIVRTGGLWQITSKKAGQVKKENFKSRYQVKKEVLRKQRDGWTVINVEKRDTLEKEISELQKDFEGNVDYVIKEMEDQKEEFERLTQKQAEINNRIGTYTEEQIKEMQDSLDRDRNKLEKREKNLDKHRIKASTSLIKTFGLTGQLLEGPVAKEGGYVTDPADRFSLFAGNAARSWAQLAFMQGMLNDVERYTAEGKHKTDPVGYNEALTFIKQMALPDDNIDRWVNTVKGLASLKYLTTVRAGLVNMSALATTTPPALHQHAMGGQGKITKAARTLFTAGIDYLKYLKKAKKGIVNPGDIKGINEEEINVLNQWAQEGHTNPIFSMEAMGNIYGELQGPFRKLLNKMMFIFSRTEKWNRGSTLLAGFRLARKQGLRFEEAKKKAEFATIRAHGLYGKETQPSWARGSNPLSKLGAAYFTFQKFGQTYLYNLYDLGFKQRNVKAALWLYLSNPLIGGLSSLAGINFLFPFIGVLMKAMGDDRDPEKMFYEGIRERFGSKPELFARYGISGGIFNLDLSGSLQSTNLWPSDKYEVAGPSGGMFKDFLDAGDYFLNGQYGRGAELLFPAFISNIIRAVREREGLTTRKGRPIVDPETDKMLMPSVLGTAKRVLGFRSAESARAGQVKWEGRREKAKFSEKRQEIYELYRDYLLTRNLSKYRKVLKLKKAYNKELRDKKLDYPKITDESLKRIKKEFHK